MKAQEIDADLDRIAGSFKKSALESWFEARPELWAAVEARTVNGDFPAMTMFFYLAEKHDFPFGESTFRHYVRKHRGKKAQAA